MENHAKRPEIQDALTLGTGEITRFSTTLGKQMMYLAIPVSYNNNILGIVRVALPLTRVEESVNHIIVSIVVAMVIAAVLVIIAAWIIVRMTTRPIREITRASRELAAGKFGEKILVDTRDEAEQLAHAFNEMSVKLKEMLGTISEDRTRLTSILDNMADGVILTDAEGNLVMTNKTAQKLFKIDGEKAKSKPFIEAIREHELNDLLVSCLETGKEQIDQFELANNNKFVRVITIPITSDRTGGVLMLIQDLTELRGLQTMRREMVGNISHEFRTPLAGIKAMVETLQDGAVNQREPARDFLSRIDTEVDRMTQLVEELTELSRIETGKVELKMEPLDLNGLAEEVVAQIKPQVERQKLTIETKLANDLPAIPADKERLQQVMINLIHNAIKFNRPAGSIKVTTRASEDSVSLEVADTGIGIAPENLPHIFERFYKADRSRAGHGSGIGLAIARHVVESHGGTIRVESEEGKGSTFIFNLPVNRPR
jgi:two-component system phosphate regulon sensor histidine kinase PhoR